MKTFEDKVVLVGKSVSGGALITTACAVYCGVPDKTMGAFLFSLGLLAVLLFNNKLYTGVTWKLRTPLNRTGMPVWDVLLVLLGNFAGCVFLGILYSWAYKYEALRIIDSKAVLMCASDIRDALASLLMRSVLCGVLMAIAIQSYHKCDGLAKMVMPVLCVMGFIMAGAEHSIADMGYLAISMKLFSDPVFSWSFISVVCVGNLLGGKIINFALTELK